MIRGVRFIGRFSDARIETHQIGRYQLPFHLRRIAIVSLVVACFMPYLSIFGIGLRVEQILIYGLLIFLPFFAIQLGLNRKAIAVLAALLLQLIASIWAFFTFDRTDEFPPVGILAGLDTLFLPIATILVVAMVAKPLSQHSDLLSIASRCLVILCCLNVFVAALLQPRWIEQSPLKIFWSWPADMWSVAEQAQLGFRYSGIFNQPAEVGFAYGIALAVLLTTCDFSRKWTFMFTIVLIFGGLLAASKTFYGCAAVIGVYFLWKGARGKCFFKSLMYVAISIALPLATLWPMGLLQDRISRVDIFSRISESNNAQAPEIALSSGSVLPTTSKVDIVADTLTGGRVGPASNSFFVLDQVAANSPFIGFGAEGWAVAYDSTWTEAMVLGGGIGVALNGFIFLVLIVLGVSMLRNVPKSALLLVLTSCALVSSLGIGAITANRVSTLFWLLITLLAFGAAQNSKVSLRTPKSLSGF